MQQEIILRTEHSWTNPLNALQEAIDYSFIKFCIYCFSLWYKFFVHYVLRVKNKIINMVLMQDLWNFSFFSWGDVSPTHSELCHFVSGSQAEHQVSSPIIVLLKKIFVCIVLHNNVLARCDWIFPLLGCQGAWNKMCTQLSLSQILFQNLKNCSLGGVQRFCYHSWCDLTVIFYEISNSCNVYLSLSQFWAATSLVIFYQLPSVSKSRIPSKIVWLLQSLIPVSLLHQY